MAEPRPATLRRAPKRWFDALMYAGLFVVATLGAITANGLWSRTWSQPLFYTSDALAAAATYKGTLETGWYESNPALGAPAGQNYHGFPVADNMQFVLVRLAGLFTDDWAVASNAVYMLSYALAAVCALWFFREIGVGRAAAASAALLFAFAPYHSVQGYAHLSLSLYFPVALIGVVLFRAMMGRPIWGERSSGPWWLRWVTGRSVGILIVVALLGTTSSYYSVFALVLMAAIAFVLVLRRTWRRLVGLGVAMVSLIAAMLVNMAPDLLYRGPTNYLSFARQPLESELYALKFSALVLPTPWNRLDGLGEWRMRYEWDFLLPSERPVLGLIAAIGFVFLMFMPAVRGVLANRRRRTSPLMRKQSALAALTVVAFFFGTVGGFATLFALLVSPSIRAWNRIVIFLMLFALAAVALLIDVGLRRLARRRDWSARRTGGALCATFLVVTAVGLVDQVAPSDWGLTGDEAARWQVDESYAQSIEERMPAGSLILQAPYMGFPESQPINDMLDYEHLRPFLHSDGLRWTYGGMKGLPRSSWSERVLALPGEEMLAQAAVAGVDGIHIDRFGFPGHDASALEKEIEKYTGAEPLPSSDDRYVFFDIRSYAAEVEARLGADETSALSRRVLSSPEMFWGPDFTGLHPEGVHQVVTSLAGGGTITIGNPGAKFEGRLRLLLRADGAAEPVDMTVTYPDGTQETVSVPIDGYRIDREVTIPAGSSSLGVTRSDGQIFSVLDARIVDRGLVRSVRHALLASSG